MMLYLILLITAVCSSVCGTAQDGDTKHQMLCKIRESCQDTDLTKPNPNDTSSANDLCRAAEDDLKSLDPSTCESLLAREKYDQGDNENPEQPDSVDGQIFDMIEKLLSREIEDQTDNDKPEKPDNVDSQTTHTDPAPPALSKRGNYFSDCSEIHTAQSLYHTVSSGVHKIQPVGLSSPISVYCDQTTDGGGWTVIQRRFDGSIDFNRPYNAFRYGFGPADGEYWLGLENMYRLTNQHTYTLYVQLEDWNSVVKYAKYSSFSVGSSSSNYLLSVSGYSGTAGDGFYLSTTSSGNYLSGQAFSARDVDRDAWSGGSCAGGHGAYTGGWWYKSCTTSALNGPYLRPSDRTGHSGWGIAWVRFGGSYFYYLKKSKMMVRPANFRP
ncbi:PREDICTED: microfibril-associated glycoprotein 4-like [Branchiostoma belcheri]|uniref:Microfibril-associated glycoprotein 4-like n=1 Tax=Branchiostoma belcheri TaxID=7741 RepID=A0A6P4YF63_BRABE|nr:PREDICTED: microfibril-associated glycoprotein 4-like [Branchiostoma belcheri]